MITEERQRKYQRNTRDAVETAIDLSKNKAIPYESKTVRLYQKRIGTWNSVADNPRRHN